jgi:hypothetical protein
MSEFETRFGADDDAEQIRAAFYGFVSRHADDGDVDGDAHISTEIGWQGPSLRVRLWSAEAMAAFLSGLSQALQPAGSPCFE